MTNLDTIRREVAEVLPLRSSQIEVFTDSILLRNKADGSCGLASCIYVGWKGEVYALSCHHALTPNHEYISGAKRLTSSTIDESDSHAVPALTLVAEDNSLDLALFATEGLDISTIPKRAYDLEHIEIQPESAQENLQTASFIHAVPGFSVTGTQYSDGLVYMDLPIYSAYGPIVEVTDELIVADFAEKELIEVDEATYPKLKDFNITQGARHLGGMSGSGLWVIGGGRFVLLGILLGCVDNNDDESEHRIKFTPIWKVLEWIRSLPLKSSSEQGVTPNH